jgi:hypothetical protein
MPTCPRWDDMPAEYWRKKQRPMFIRQLIDCHINNINSDGELSKEAICKCFLLVRKEVNYSTRFVKKSTKFASNLKRSYL